jgi:transposase-like protein
MAILSEITELLRRWDVWKKVEEAPARIDALEARIAALEGALAKCPAEGCPFCGARAFRLERVSMHGQREEWKCGECGKGREVRLDLAKGKRPSGPATWGR